MEQLYCAFKVFIYTLSIHKLYRISFLWCFSSSYSSKHYIIKCIEIPYAEPYTKVEPPAAGIIQFRSFTLSPPNSNPMQFIKSEAQNEILNHNKNQINTN